MERAGTYIGILSVCRGACSYRDASVLSRDSSYHDARGLQSSLLGSEEFTFGFKVLEKPSYDE